MITGDIQKLTPDMIGRLNSICAHQSGADAPWLGEAVEESARVSLHAATLGRTVFGAFRDGRSVGRIEVMPIDLAPLPLEGKGLHVKVVTKEWILRNRADALRLGRENTVYVDGKEPFAAGFRTAAFCELVKERLAAKR
jgi:hypothetical protein